MPTRFRSFYRSDCVVIDAEAVAATIEVKTAIGSEAARRSTLEKVTELKLALPGRCAICLCAWEGPSSELALDCVCGHRLIVIDDKDAYFHAGPLRQGRTTLRASCRVRRSCQRSAAIPGPRTS
jgi:hypothetical protein